MVIQDKLYTAQDLENMPNDGKRYELDDGALTVMNPPAHKHALISGRLLTRLSVYAEKEDAGYVTGSDGGYLLHTDPQTGRQTVYVPDVAFIGKARRASNADDLYNGAPDLAVEVISPSETHGMIERKLRNYFAYGARLVWLVYAEARIIEVYTTADAFTELNAEATLEGGDVLPSFSIKISEIFAVLDK